MAYITSYIVTQKIYNFTFENTDEFWNTYRQPKITQLTEVYNDYKRLLRNNCWMLPDKKSILFCKEWANDYYYDEYRAAVAVHREKQTQQLTYTRCKYHGFTDEKSLSWINY
jgi:hypothetical protein|tara:strand:+ start:10182 stop:10517 length:336 start_codon:yes stop_codon:yes gene_type:complete